MPPSRRRARGGRSVFHAVNRPVRGDAFALETHGEQRVAGQHHDICATLTRGIERPPQRGFRVSILYDDEKH
jgi:hypothetical protein